MAEIRWSFELGTDGSGKKINFCRNRSLGDEGRPGDGSPGLSMVSNVGKEKGHSNILDGLKVDDSGEATIIREFGRVLPGACQFGDLINLAMWKMWI